MAERKVHCPEGGDCWRPDCSIKICIERQTRIFAEQREAEREANFRSDRATRKVVALRVARALFSEHNDLIAANKPGVLKDGNGNIIETSVTFPEGARRGSNKYCREYDDRERLVALVLASKSPQIVTRFCNVMDTMVAETRRMTLTGQKFASEIDEARKGLTLKAADLSLLDDL